MPDDYSIEDVIASCKIPASSEYAASFYMPDDDAYTIIDWIDQVNADPDVDENDDDDTATEWDEMSDYDLDEEEDDQEEDGDEFWVS